MDILNLYMLSHCSKTIFITCVLLNNPTPPRNGMYLGCVMLIVGWMDFVPRVALEHRSIYAIYVLDSFMFTMV